MSNTLIQIKRSSITAVPSSLNIAEPAYSYLSNKLFIGDATGSAVIAVGGQFFVDQQNTIFGAVNAAFQQANTANPTSIAAFNAANGAFAIANIALANTSFANTVARAAYDFANTVNTSYAYPAFVAVGPAFDKANAANNFAYSTNLGMTASFGAANAGFLQANTARDIAIAAYANANTKLSASGGTINGDLSVTGNIYLLGAQVIANVETIRISDPLLYLAGNNFVSDVVDIGFVGGYNDGSSNLKTGMFRDAGTKEWYVFHGYTQEPNNNHIDPSANGFTLGVLNAAIRTSNLTLAGVNTVVWIASAFGAANAGFTAANAAFLNSNTAYAHANNINTIAVFANTTASAAYNKANSANLYAYTVDAASQAGYTQANAAYSFANTANVNAANASFLSTGTVPSARISGSYSSITGVGTITTGEWNGTTIDVGYGGTGRTTFTPNGILYGNTSGAINITGAGSEGQVLQATSTGVPQFGFLDGGTF